ncbi:chromosome segregation protein SMC [Lederbergia sp. NSJ-179]|uniref:chromosome segregation protein SMC n=1 Tax=Lederbergia sp. NSJ-179 TaxID=2931402 RepID=UPI001FD1ED50|nr:chromosome segregation protein SMC [Lederbergia sp. NSJ-179]MCJ7839611.1 chromosome segregation protein SMC [Lederbergia sp. NSJ-179]
MFLKQLDIIGFKSFAEKTTLEFVPGVTAVVGPNGSGKSNITDAIRWVLGEQSAKSLRGGKMEDVIFAGSDSRKPLNFAEVSLTLNNEDGTLPVEYNEVCVARRVFRTGDSEYLLNGHSCRLKDIIDLFIDSGLGKEAFSIISQGKIEEILNSKPEERRTIFEEAAGVLKYKNRKKKAAFKLQETTENLNRVNDILYELESQMEPLKVQASMAKDYLQKKKDLETHEIALTVYEIGEKHSQWEASKQEVERLTVKEADLSSHIQQVESSLEKERNNLTTLDEKIAEWQSALLTSSKELEKLQGRLGILTERKNNAALNSGQLQKNISDAEQKMIQIKQKQEETKVEWQEKKQEAKNIKKLLTEKRKKASTLNDSIEETIESLKSDYIEVLNQQASAKNEFHYLEQQLKQQISKSNRLDEENKRYLEQRKEYMNQLDKNIKAVEDIEKELTSQIEQFRETQALIGELKEKYEEKNALINKAYQFIQKAESRKDTLEEMEEDYTGFYHGVREVLKAKKNELSGIEGAIAELIHVPPQFAKAIETALGGAMQHIVVRTEADARNAIAFLKRKQMGRATFLPMNVIKGKSLPINQQRQLSSHPAYIGIAESLVDSEEFYKPAVQHLLGNIVIADSLAGANQIAKLLQFRYRIVTLDGDVINLGGSMTGGASKQKTTSLIGRKTELEELKNKLAEMKSKTKVLEEEWHQLKLQLTNAEHKLETMKENGEKLRIQKNEAQSVVTQIEMNKKNIDDRLALYDLETNELKGEKNKIKERMDDLEEITSNCNEKIITLNQKIEELTKQRNNERQSKESLEKEINELSSRNAVINEQLQSTEKHLENLIMEYKEMEANKNSLMDDLNFLQGEMTGHQTSEEDLTEQIKLQSIEKKQSEEQLNKKREDRFQLQVSIEQKEATLKEQKRLYNGISNALRDEEVKKNRLDVELDNLLHMLREEYSLSYEGAKEQYPLILSVEETRKKVKLIKRGLDELGSVNLGAIEEYDRVYERYHFLLEQQKDLTEAKTHLFRVMDEMDDEMKRRFSTTFYEIQDQFMGVFRALFGGGRAELKLTEPADLLNTGVDIVAQPPGKKLQNLSLLSGGERSLTAIALLFSILKIRPVPFCVLDEVEAALDEANVQRFSHYLRAFSQETQFIVITHRQGTMQGADVLYGVTMQESGVSKIVSVKLENAQEMVQ